MEDKAAGIQIPIGERMASLEMGMRGISQQLTALGNQISPLVLQQSGLLGRVDRLEQDVTRSHDKHREVETWKAQIEGRLSKNDLDNTKHWDELEKTLQRIADFMASQGRTNDLQDRINAEALEHRKEEDRRRDRIFGGLLVVQGLIGLAITFKDQILKLVLGQ